jgi:hypothetical protein
MKKLSKEEIEACKSAKGGYSRAALARFGVPWPPPRGWKQALIKGQAIAPRKNSKA